MQGYSIDKSVGLVEILCAVLLQTWSKWQFVPVRGGWGYCSIERGCGFGQILFSLPLLLIINSTLDEKKKFLPHSWIWLPIHFFATGRMIGRWKRLFIHGIALYPWTRNIHEWGASSWLHPAAEHRVLYMYIYTLTLHIYQINHHYIFIIRFVFFSRNGSETNTFYLLFDLPALRIEYSILYRYSWLEPFVTGGALFCPLNKLSFVTG